MHRRDATPTTPSAPLSLKVRIMQAPEPESALAARPMDAWVEGLRSAFEPGGGRKSPAPRLPRSA